MGWEDGDKVPETTGGDPAGLSEIRRVSEKEGGRPAASTSPMAKPAPPDFTKVGAVPAAPAAAPKDRVHPGFHEAKDARLAKQIPCPGKEFGIF